MKNENYNLLDYVMRLSGILNIFVEGYRKSLLIAIWNENTQEKVDWGEASLPEGYANSFFDNFDYTECEIGKSPLHLDEYEIYLFKDKSDIDSVFFFREKHNFGYLHLKEFEKLFKLDNNKFKFKNEFGNYLKEIKKNVDVEFERFDIFSFLIDIEKDLEIIRIWRNKLVHLDFNEIFAFNVNIKETILNDVFDYDYETIEILVTSLESLRDKYDNLFDDFEVGDKDFFLNYCDEAIQIIKTKIKNIIEYMPL